jgi:hypothetical protein
MRRFFIILQKCGILRHRILIKNYSKMLHPAPHKKNTDPSPKFKYLAYPILAQKAGNGPVNYYSTVGNGTLDYYIWSQ